MADWFDSGAWSFLDNSPTTGLGSDADTFDPNAAATSTLDVSPRSLVDSFPQIDWGAVLAPNAPLVPTTPGVDLTRGLGIPASPMLGLGGPGFNPNGGGSPALGYDRATGQIIRLDTGQPVLAADQVKLLVQAVQGGDQQGLAKILDPVNRMLNTPLGGTLAALGLGGLGIGLSRAIAGDSGKFQPPARVQGVGMNPAAQALAQEIRMRNLRGLTTLTPDAATSGDPITVDLAGRLRKALAGEVSNPVLERSQKKDTDQLEARMLRKTGGSPLWRDTSAGIEERGRLDESHNIQRYLDNQDTIGRLDPAVRARQAQESTTRANLSGLNTMDADRQFENALAMQLAQNEYLTERSERADLAKGIAQLFGRVGTGVLDANARPWDRPRF